MVARGPSVSRGLREPRPTFTSLPHQQEKTDLLEEFERLRKMKEDNPADYDYWVRSQLNESDPAHPNADMPGKHGP